jgi:hypothetical protein
MAFVIPVGFNWADGSTVLPVQPNGSAGSPTIIGTPLPTAQVEMYYSGQTSDLIQEESGSPEIERAEQCTCRHELKMPYTTGLQYWSQMGRGTMVTDTGGNIWRILSSNLKRLNEPCKIPGQAVTTWSMFSYVAESISFDSPPDDFDVQEVSLDLNIIKHPRYAWALNPYPTDSSTYTTVGGQKVYYTEIKEAIIRMIQNYIESPFFPTMNQTNSLIQINILNAITNGTFQISVTNPNFVAPNNSATKIPEPVAWDGTSAYPSVNCPYFLLTLTAANLNLAVTSNSITIALAAAKELISKLWRQEDTPYIAGYKVIWVQKVFSTVYLNCGGYIEDPRQVVPQYFMNPFNNGIIPRSYASGGYAYDTSAPDSSSSIFDLLPIINPQCYSVTGITGGALSFSCLRTSDTIRYDRTFFDVTHSWLCAPLGKFDSQLYTNGNRPQISTDYTTLY